MANTKSLDLELSSSQYASIADASQTGLDITGDISVVAWIDLEELPSTATTDFTIIGKWTSASGKRSYLFWIESGDDKLYFRYSDDGEFTSAVTTLVSTTALGAGYIAYWKLNDDYLDVTANNNDLTASGSPVFSASVPFANYSGGAATTNYLKYYKRSYGMS